MSLTFIGILHSFTTLIFSCSILTCLFPTITPRIGISSILKSYFDCLKHRLCFSAIFKNLIILSSNYSIVFAGITKSSIQFASTPLWSNSQKILFIILWNIPSKLHSPKYITYGSNSPLFIRNAAFYLSPSLICTLLYLQIRSNLLKYLASLSLSITSPIRDNGILFFIVIWLSFLQSWTNCNELSFFGMQKQGATYHDFDSTISPTLSCSSNH